MLVTSQLLIQTTQILYSFFVVHLCPLTLKKVQPPMIVETACYVLSLEHESTSLTIHSFTIDVYFRIGGSKHKTFKTLSMFITHKKKSNCWCCISHSEQHYSSSLQGQLRRSTLPHSRNLWRIRFRWTIQCASIATAPRASPCQQWSFDFQRSSRHDPENTPRNRRPVACREGDEPGDGPGHPRQGGIQRVKL